MYRKISKSRNKYDSIKAAPRFPLKTLADVWKALSPGDRKQLIRRAAETHRVCEDDIRYDIAAAAARTLEASFRKEAKEMLRWILKDIEDEVERLYEDLREQAEEEAEEQGEEFTGEIEPSPEALVDAIEDALVYGLKFEDIDRAMKYTYDIPDKELIIDIKYLLEQRAPNIGTGYESLADVLEDVFCHLYGQGAMDTEEEMADTLRQLYREFFDEVGEAVKDKFDVDVDVADLYMDDVEDMLNQKDWAYTSVTDDIADKAPKLLDRVLSTARNIKLKSPIEDEEELELAVWGD